MRYDYSSHKTRDAAEMALEHYYAAGEVSECERPRIERRGARYVVTLEG
jgi:hypothetical protein